ncbi:hypothetical protein ONS95_008520 [Cadophora gregata]|uniref:uncharacterized protein n=1 Tax=Cadophora gregata TaxID=51156 RepID=UPI0026DAC981|nr:uncharacterized protein ONS95_008520 [Cadophora gregata]KAK0100182.1 hypothetical protein ONS95_008520 [Cadophora gregata]KAK0114870.1 hypothetical protein ONS96_013350 [Cadophora gregata f. sp. sojae]
MFCGLPNVFRKRHVDLSDHVTAQSSSTDERTPSYSNAASPAPRSDTSEDHTKRELTPEETRRNILQGLYAQRNELLDTIEGQPTVQEARLQFQEATRKFGKSGWDDEGRREYNRAERRCRMIEAKHWQHQRKLKEIEREICQMRPKRR